MHVQTVTQVLFVFVLRRMQRVKNLVVLAFQYKTFRFGS